MKVDMLRVGLTGGIGSGKSTVAAMLQTRGATIVDADAISREITGPKGAALAEIASVFGLDFLDTNGALNRPKMREIAFNSALARSKLEHILHPLVRGEILAQADLAYSNGAVCVVFDIPLLVESNIWRQFVDTVLIVDCTLETQFARVKARNGLSDAVVQSIISTQASRPVRLNAADIVLFNDTDSLTQLATRVEAIANRFGL